MRAEDTLTGRGPRGWPTIALAKKVRGEAGWGSVHTQTACVRRRQSHISVFKRGPCGRTVAGLKRYKVQEGLL